MRASVARVSPFSSVLCPVDFSRDSGVALQYAAALAGRSHAPLHVMFVNDPLLVAAAAAAYNTATIGAASRLELERFVRSTLSTRAFARLKPACRTALGKPAREILRAVQQNEHDLIVIGTKGLNGAKRLLLGSTTAEVLRRARIPVLAVPPADAGAGRRVPIGASWPGKTIVAAIEFGTHAPKDILRAANVARWCGANLLLVHVVPVPVAPAWMSADVEQHLRTNCDEAEAALEALQGELKGARSTVIVRVGHPPDQIAAVAEEYQAGLVVMGLRGRSGLFGEPAGTCAYQVLCHGVAPVLALPDVGRVGPRR
jgi:nucleotide-binding universal stress UspA family protein